MLLPTTHKALHCEEQEKYAHLLIAGRILNRVDKQSENSWKVTRTIYVLLPLGKQLLGQLVPVVKIVKWCWEGRHGMNKLGKTVLNSWFIGCPSLSQRWASHHVLLYQLLLQQWLTCFLVFFATSCRAPLTCFVRHCQGWTLNHSVPHDLLQQHGLCSVCWFYTTVYLNPTTPLAPPLQKNRGEIQWKRVQGLK